MARMTDSSANNSTSTSSNVRSLNDLPDEILLHILSFRSTTREIVRTTTLISRKWRKLWLSNPILIFHNLNVSSREFYVLQRFASFVNETLIRRPPNTPLLTFDLIVNFTNGVSASQINSWIRYAVSHGVEKLHLGLQLLGRHGRSRFEFHFGVLRDGNVRVLKLRACDLSLPPPPSSSLENNNFSSLQSIKIDDVDMTDKMIVELVACCVNLEVLILSSVKGCKDVKITSSKIREITMELFKCEEGSLEIVAPNLKTLTLNDVNVGNYAIMDSSSLVEASIYLYEYEYWVKMMRLVGHVKHLSTVNMWFQLMQTKDIESGCFTLQNLKSVELGTSYKKYGFIGVSLLLLLTPNIQTLTLDNYSIFDEIPDGSITADFVKQITFDLPCLRQVKMKSFMGMEAEKHLLTLLLKWAVALERIILIPAVRRRKAPKPPIVLDPKLNSHQELNYYIHHLRKRRKMN